MKEPGKTEGPCATKKLCTISGLHLQNQATLVQICSFKNNALSHGLEVKEITFQVIDPTFEVRGEATMGWRGRWIVGKMWQALQKNKIKPFLV